MIDKELYRDLYRPEEVAEKLGVSVFTIYRWIREGQLPAIKLGRLYWIKWQDILDKGKK